MNTSSSLNPLQQQVEEAIAAIRAKTTFQPNVGAVLGSGLGYLADHIEPVLTIPYNEIPHFPLPSVEGHQGKLVLGHLDSVPVAFLSGRIHLYEGFTPQQVVFPVRVLRQLGASVLIVTNAAGGINKTFVPGDLMLIEDHLNLTGRNPLMGPNVKDWGPRFPDMGEAYNTSLKELAKTQAQAQNLTLKTGVYAGLTGPSYETPAEIRMLRGFGADAVGMSTVLEVIAARHIGFRTLAISCISNLAADIHPGELSHEEVTEAVETKKDAFGQFLRNLLTHIPQELYR